MTTHNVRRKGARHVAIVASYERIDEEYEIARLPDGALACACMAYAFSKKRPKTCKHLGALAADTSTAAQRVQTKAVTFVRPVPVTVESAGERFSVLRGIDLSDL